MKNKLSKYFLAANSAEGFVSHFVDSYNIYDGWRTYIIKGGPGTGKSSFMKYVTIKALEKGYTVELCPCSSDPDSLDGVIINDIKTVLLDGTPPHIVEPKHPGICEEIINLGVFWNRDILYKKAEQIIDMTNKNKKQHQTASAYISAAGELIYDNFKKAEQFTNLKKAEQFAVKTAARLIPKNKNHKAFEWVRFVSGVTPKGIVTFNGTIEEFYKNVVVLEDKYGAAANIIMQKMREAALEKGYEIITLKNPFLPSKIIDGILIPKFSLAFVREYEYMHFDPSYRRIHARRFYNNNALKCVRTRLTFNRRIAKELLLGAAKTLQKAKVVHDSLEKCYIDAMNFNALTAFAEQKVNEIL